MPLPSELHAVIESPTDAPSFAVPLPAQPWPSHVRLWGRTEETGAALVVAQLARYGHGGSGPQDLASLVDSFPKVVPGGISASDELQEVHPSCCCGLETWREWNQVLTASQGPWLGHSPAPWVELRDDAVLVWPDGGLGNANTDGLRPIRFSSAEFEAALVNVEADLRNFLHRLRDWASPRSPQLAERLADGFAALLRMDSTPEENR